MAGSGALSAMLLMAGCSRNQGRERSPGERKRREREPSGWEGKKGKKEKEKGQERVALEGGLTEQAMSVNRVERSNRVKERKRKEERGAEMDQPSSLYRQLSRHVGSRVENSEIKSMPVEEIGRASCRERVYVLV